MQIKKGYDIKLVIVGGGSKATGEFSIPDEMKENIKGIEDKIIFTGGLNQEQLVNIFANAVATIVPSYYESFGMVAAESQATGTLVIATNVGGLQEVVKNEITGYLFEKKDIETLSMLMAKIYENKYVRNKLGEQAKDFAKHHFNWDIITNRIILLYEELMYEDEGAIYISN